MINILLLLSMIFCHIVDDYYLQGILAQMKQKEWWKLHYPDSLYKNDYKVALYAHAFSWTFMIHLPVVLYRYMLHKPILSPFMFLVFFILVMLHHAYIDNKKANKHTISLKTDQLNHLLCIILLFIYYVV